MHLAHQRRGQFPRLVDYESACCLKSRTQLKLVFEKWSHQPEKGSVFLMHAGGGAQMVKQHDGVQIVNVSQKGA